MLQLIWEHIHATMMINQMETRGLIDICTGTVLISASYFVVGTSAFPFVLGCGFAVVVLGNIEYFLATSKRKSLKSPVFIEEESKI